MSGPASFRPFLGRGLIQLPGVHDALSARVAEQAGFVGVSVGGSTLAATQLALPDIGLQSFGEYRDAVGRIVGACQAPVMVDGENGFGDVRAVHRTVQCLEQLGVAAVAFEDLHFPPRAGSSSVVSLAEITSKLAAALKARSAGDMMVIGRTDAAYVVSLDEALSRVKSFEQVGVDAVLVPGLANLDAMKRLRDSTSLPLISVVVEGGRWFAPSRAELEGVGFDMAVYPATMLLRQITAQRAALDAIHRGDVSPPPNGTTFADLAGLTRSAEWAARLSGEGA